MHHAKIEPAIHPAWCTCSDCKHEAEKRSIKFDLLIIGLGLLAGLTAAGWLWLTGAPR